MTPELPEIRHVQTGDQRIARAFHALAKVEGVWGWICVTVHHEGRQWVPIPMSVGERHERRVREGAR